VVGAEDEAHGVEQEDGRFGLGWHGSSLAGGRYLGPVFWGLAGLKIEGLSPDSLQSFETHPSS
jgi:hypothetical protein